MADIGLFPLGIVLLPGERISLHIFEPRYKELIGECLDTESEFGIVYADDDGMRAVGTRAAVVEVLERFDDGRLHIVVEGRVRFRVVEVTEGRSFVTADIAPLEDDAAPPPQAQVDACLEAYRSVVEIAGLTPDEPRPGTKSVALHIAIRVDFGPAARQELLEMTDETERLESVGKLLQIASVALRAGAIAQKARGNGHAPQSHT